MEQLSVRTVYTERLGHVSFGEVDPDQQSLRALVKRIASHDDEGYLKSLLISAVVEEQRAEAVEDTKADLAEVLPLEDRPVLVPASQHVTPIGPQRMGHVGPLEPWRALIEHRCALPHESVKVDCHCLVEPDMGR